MIPQAERQGKSLGKFFALLRCSFFVCFVCVLLVDIYIYILFISAFFTGLIDVPTKDSDEGSSVASSISRQVCLKLQMLALVGIRAGFVSQWVAKRTAPL